MFMSIYFTIAVSYCQDLNKDYVVHTKTPEYLTIVCKEYNKVTSYKINLDNTSQYDSID